MNTFASWIKWLIISVIIAFLNAILVIANACYGFWVSSAANAVALICSVWCINTCYKKIKAKEQQYHKDMADIFNDIKYILVYLKKLNPAIQNEKCKESAN